MEEHMADLNVLAKKYQEQVDSLQGQLDEARRKFTVVSEAIQLLKREGVFDQERLFQSPMVISEKYKDKTLSSAIEDVLRSNQPEKLSASFIHSELVKNGFSSDSKNIKRDVYTRLNRLEKSGKILSTKRGGKGNKKYFLKEGAESSPKSIGSMQLPGQ